MVCAVTATTLRNILYLKDGCLITIHIIICTVGPGAIPSLPRPLALRVN